MFTLTKTYEFSASYSSGGRLTAHNYRLIAAFGDVTGTLEHDLDGRIQGALIGRIHSRDLGQDVDFLRGLTLTDTSLLKAFWPVIAKAASPASLLSLALESDARTRWTLTHTQ